jgi:transcriptional regulator with XRE-family HTH domain
MTARSAIFDPVAFGRSIRILLAELNIQQREAARMMGVDKCVLNRICKHGNPPSVENYLRIVGWMNKQSAALSKAHHTGG